MDGADVSYWQAIETAPKDGSRVLVCDEYGVPMFVSWLTGMYDGREGWRCQMHLPAWIPSYWFPLPSAPNAV